MVRHGDSFTKPDYYYYCDTHIPDMTIWRHEIIAYVKLMTRDLYNVLTRLFIYKSWKFDPNSFMETKRYDDFSPGVRARPRVGLSKLAIYLDLASVNIVVL